MIGKYFKLNSQCTSASECGSSDYCLNIKDGIGACFDSSTLSQTCNIKMTCVEGLGCDGNGFCRELCSSKYPCQADYKCNHFSGKTVGICAKEEPQVEITKNGTPVYVTVLICVGLAILIGIGVLICFIIYRKRKRNAKSNAAAPVWVAAQVPNNYKVVEKI